MKPIELMKVNSLFLDYGYKRIIPVRRIESVQFDAGGSNE